jgi:hypothetical protein
MPMYRYLFLVRYWEYFTIYLVFGKTTGTSKPFNLMYEVVSDATGNGTVNTMLRNYVDDRTTLNWSIALHVQLPHIQHSTSVHTAVIVCKKPV